MKAPRVSKLILLVVSLATALGCTHVPQMP